MLGHIWWSHARKPAFTALLTSVYKPWTGREIPLHMGPLLLTNSIGSPRKRSTAHDEAILVKNREVTLVLDVPIGKRAPSRDLAAQAASSALSAAPTEVRGLQLSAR